MRSLLWVGLVCSLLIVGALGGLIAPPPSDAANATLPTISITVKLSNGTTTTNQLTLLSPVTCPAGGPNYCYPIVTYDTDVSKIYGPPNRQFKVLNVPNTPGARLNISDYGNTLTTVPSDAMVLTGVQFVPLVTAAGWPTNETVYLTITVHNKFDAQPNPQANGTSTFYPYGMTIGGNFASGGSPIGDISQLWGTGIFVTGTGSVPAGTQPRNISNTNTNYDANKTVNSFACTEGNAAKSPLCHTVAAPGGQAQLTFSAGQTNSVYPGAPTANPTTQRFACSNNLAAGAKTVVDPRGTTRSYTDPSCQPNITEVHYFTLLGPDSVVLSASSAGGGKVCKEPVLASTTFFDSDVDNLLLIDGEEGAPILPLCACSSGGGTNSACDSIFTLGTNEKNHEDQLNQGIPASLPCSVEICNGTLRTLIRVTPATALSLAFTGNGPRITDFVVNSNAGGAGELLPPFASLITGRGGTDITISADTAHWPVIGHKGWQVDQISCLSLNGSTIIGTDVVNGTGPTKGPLIVHAIGNGDTVTCEWHVHNETTK